MAKPLCISQNAMKFVVNCLLMPFERTVYVPEVAFIANLPFIF